MTRATRYAKSGAVSIAYQVIGDGPIDVVFVPGFVSHVELFWEIPSIARAWQRLSSFARLIVFDKRGTGLSDRGTGVPTLEERLDDVRAVMDAAGSAARGRSATPRAGSGSPSARACTRASAWRAATTCRGSRCTSAPASPRSRGRTRCW